MNPELKAKWVAALRSGKYQQGRGCLRREDAFCCLGVLADLVEPSAWTADGDGWLFHDHFSVLPGGMAFEFGIDDKQGDLAEMNDDGMLFVALADHIEANL